MGHWVATSLNKWIAIEPGECERCGAEPDDYQPDEED